SSRRERSSAAPRRSRSSSGRISDSKAFGLPSPGGRGWPRSGRVRVSLSTVRPCETAKLGWHVRGVGLEWGRRARGRGWRPVPLAGRGPGEPTWPGPQAKLFVVLAAGAASLAMAHWTLRAQEPREPTRGVAPRVESPAAPAPSVQDALLRVHALPFAEETKLDDVAAYLRKSLKAAVVLDLAALRRLELTPDSTVRLQLH